MSWDVFFQDLPAGIRSIDEIPDDFQPGPIGSRADVLAAIRAAVPDVDFTDPTWGVVERDGFSIEVNIRADDPVHSFALHVRGGGAALEVVRALAAALGRPALDPASASGLTFGASGA
jgi:hypothetical protein